MTRSRRPLGALGALVAVTATALAVWALPGSAAPAQQATITTKRTVPIRILTLHAAQRLANLAVRDCAARGFSVTAAVVDRDGVQVATLRHHQATGATVATAIGKAVAAAGFRSPTSALAEAAKTNPGLLTVPDFVVLAGGLPLAAGDTLFGAIGVSGTPSGQIDESCAAAAVDAVF